MSEQELYVLSYYRAGELTGSLLFGKLALHTEADDYRVLLTEQCLEEAEHAWIFTKAIQDLGGIPLRVTRTYQGEYAREFGMPKNLLEIFCLTQVLEKRVLDHYEKHMNLPQTHPVIKKALQKNLDDETEHVDGMKVKLDEYAALHGREKVQEVLGRAKEVDERVYARLSQSSPFREYFRELL